MNFFVQHECKRIRLRYKHPKLSSGNKNESLMMAFGMEDSEVMNKEEDEEEEEAEVVRFVEFDIRKKQRADLKAITKKKEKNFLKPFMMNLNIPPLFSHKVFDVFNQVEEVYSEDVKLAIKDDKKGTIGTFLKEKVETQIAEDKKRRAELRRRKRKLLNTEDFEPKKKEKKIQKNNALEALEIVTIFKI